MRSRLSNDNSPYMSMAILSTNGGRVSYCGAAKNNGESFIIHVIRREDAKVES